MRLAAYSLTYVTLATTGLVLLRRSLADGSLTAAMSDPAFFLGGLCYAASFGTFLLALRRFEVLTVYPIFTGLAYTTVSVAAVVFLNESFGTARFLGVVFVGAGVVLLTR
jgi:multidrug transporter EmrE-like cation transporter